MMVRSHFRKAVFASLVIFTFYYIYPSSKKTTRVPPTTPPVINDSTFVPLTFDDPKTYHGPILSGWPPERSRDMSLYIRPDQDMILNDIGCLGARLREVELLVVVQSSPLMFGRRMQARQTYMRYQDEEIGVRTVFLFGTDPNENHTQLEEEQIMFCDIVQMDFVDAYVNVTVDTTMAVRFAIEHYQDKGWRDDLIGVFGFTKMRPKFLVIADDDCYINLKAMYKELLSSERNGVLKESDRIMLGRAFVKSEYSPIQHTNGNDNDRSLLPDGYLHIVPRYLYNKLRVYPPRLDGGCYVIPFHNLDCLYRESLKLPYYHLNDVFLTGFVRQMCNMTVLNDERFFTLWRHPHSILRKNILANHKSSDQGKTIMDQVLRVQNGHVETCGPEMICYKGDVLQQCHASSEDCEAIDIKEL